MSGTQLLSLLQDQRGADTLSVDGRDLSTLTVGQPPLVSGAVLVDGPSPPRRSGPTPQPLMLLTHSGPSAGAIFRIHRGRFRIGRGPVEIPVPDPGMSREHAVVDVSSTALTLSAVKGANTVFVDGQPARRRSVNSGSVVRCGNSTFTVLTESGQLPEISADAGCSVEEPLEVPHTGSPSNRLAITLAAGLPLAAGIGLAVATGMWTFLGFTAISAGSLLLPLIAGRKSRRERRTAVARAAQDDIGRRRRCSPSAAEISVAVHGIGAVAGRLCPQAAQALPNSAVAPGSQSLAGIDRPGAWLRLGTMDTAANIRIVPEDPGFRPPPIGPAPVTLDPRHPVVALSGEPNHVDALLRFMLMQLAIFPVASQSPVVILGPAGRLPLSARFLPQVTLATGHDAAYAALQDQNGSPNGRLFIIGDPVRDQVDALPSLLSAARLASWQVVYCGAPSERAEPAIEISSSGTDAYLEQGSERRPFIPDLVPDRVFDGFCRSVAAMTGQVGASTTQAIPDQCSLADLLPFGHRRILRRWEDAIPQKELTAVLGRGRNGMLAFDFKHDGPHLLIAGTTGSGKSELLRTLVASMGLKYPPDHTTFLFFDFKGGSGLRPLAGLPHCLGLLTDLASHQLHRALTSLRGEITYREELFAAAGVTDLGQYQHAATARYPTIPHLLLVIDEFRMLIDEAPAALREIIRIASIGRSLGIHLVMATQRPQGALTADIRANVTSSIALRVQSEGESVDIINSKAAASIRANVPGRAFLARAASKPEEFQAASLSGFPDVTITGTPVEDVLIVQATKQALQQRTEARMMTSHPDALPDAGVQQLVSIVQDAWRLLGKPLPRHPVAAPLPPSIRWQEELRAVEIVKRQASSATPLWAVGPVALLDRPSKQIVEPLLWFPAEDGHLAMIGGPSSGMDTCFRAASAMLATHGPQPHLYILDAAAIIGDLGGRGRIGAIAGLHQLTLAARVLKRLAEEMERRRTLSDASRASKPLCLIVTGWCSWATAFRAGPSAWAEAALQDIVRDGRSLGITVLICGERELVSSRFFAAIQNRVYFPTGSTEESRLHWPRLPEVDSLQGRAVVVGNFVEGQTTVAQFREAPSTSPWPFAHVMESEPPFRLRPLPELLGGQEFRSLLAETPEQRLPPGPEATHLSRQRVNSKVLGIPEENSHSSLWIGVGGDEAMPMSFPLRSHGVGVILGGHRSGKSSALASLYNLNSSIPWVFPPIGASQESFWATVAGDAAAGMLDPNSILLVDDADSLNAQVHKALAAVVRNVRGVVLTATPGPALVQQLPLAREVQASRTGVILAPGTPHDGELLGVRLDAGRTRPGRGFLVNGTEVKPFQGVLTTGFPPPNLPPADARTSYSTPDVPPVREA
nr:FtsK/SpoIIIE domain-containing protein [Paenarthrobacter aurescens]